MEEKKIEHDELIRLINEEIEKGKRNLHKAISPETAYLLGMEKAKEIIFKYFSVRIKF